MGEIDNFTHSEKNLPTFHKNGTNFDNIDQIHTILITFSFASEGAFGDELLCK